MVLTALGMIVLLLMAGLGVDVGYLRYQKQQMQKAADAGALAGAAAVIAYSGGVAQQQIITAARADAAANGFTDGQNGISVTVNHPPLTNNDPFLNDPRYVEVIVAQQRPTFFMRLLGYRSVNVASRAVATSVGSGSGCFYALDPTDPHTFVVDAGSTISSNCGVLIASSSTSAFEAGAGANVTARSIGVVGDCDGAGCGGLSTQPTNNIAPFTDPLANVPSPPAPSPGCYKTGFTVTGGTAHLDPAGNYCGGINLTGGTITLSPGTYYLVGGGLNVSANATVTGSGVTFFNTAGNGYSYEPINLIGSSNTNISAPVDAGNSLAGILIFQDRSIRNNTAQNIVDASNGQVFTGTLYFPTTALKYRGAPLLLNPYELLIAWKLEFQGRTQINNHYDTLPNGASPIRNATLVE